MQFSIGLFDALFKELCPHLPPTHRCGLTAVDLRNRAFHKPFSANEIFQPRSTGRKLAGPSSGREPYRKLAEEGERTCSAGSLRRSAYGRSLARKQSVRYLKERCLAVEDLQAVMPRGFWLQTSLRPGPSHFQVDPL